MFLNYRIEKLKIKVAVQKNLVDNLATAEKEYGRYHVTQTYHTACCVLTELESKLHILEAKRTDTLG